MEFTLSSREEQNSSAKGAKGDFYDENEAPPRPPPPIVGKVTHHSIELYWEDALSRLTEHCKKGDGRVRVVLQEMDKSQQWGNVYVGYGKRTVVDNLEPLTKYSYRLRFKNDHGDSDFSPVTQTNTCKEPLTSEHLHKAVGRHDLPAVCNVLDTGDVNINCPDKYSFTPLMVAAQKGFLDICETLVERGASVDEQNENLKTALMLACYAGKFDTVEFLREHGASYDTRDKSGSQPVHYATDGANLDVLKWILDDGADVNATDLTTRWTPLIRCAAVTGNREVANLLIRKGADVNHRDRDGKTALMIAVVNGHQALVELLLDCNADICIKNEYGKTAYDMAVSLDKIRGKRALEDHIQRHGITV